MYLPEEKVIFDRDYCTFCINVRDLGKNTIDRLTNATPEEVNKHYINHYQPVVITDTTKDWVEKKKIVVDDIMQVGWVQISYYRIQFGRNIHDSSDHNRENSYILALWQN